MKFNKLGVTDIKVSEICLGTMTFGEQNSEKEGHQQLDYAFEHGVNFIDTAELYAVPSTKENNGKTEQIIGSWLINQNRSEVIIGTKVTGPTQNRSYISNNLGFSKERIDEALERSLKHLQTDYIDLYQLHWPERETNRFGQRGFIHNPNERWIDNLNEISLRMDALVKSGKIRHWGLSNETPWGTMKYLQYAKEQNTVGPVSIQNPYSLLNRTYEIGMSEVSIREEIGLLVYSPLGFGLLSGKYHKSLDNENSRLNKFKLMARFNSKNSYEATRKYLELAESNSLSMTQMSLAFINQQHFVTSNIIGATSIEQLKENIESTKLHLNEEIISKINEIHNNIPNPAP